MSKVVQMPTSASGTGTQKTFQRGSGDGGGSDWELRIVKLEHTTESIKETLGRLEPKITDIHTKTSTIETELKHTLKTIPAVLIMLTVFAMGYAIPQIPHIFSKQEVKESSDMV
jgi:hypothetical protein